MDSCLKGDIMKKWGLMLLFFLTGMSLCACETTTTEYISTGTYFLWVSRVQAHFESLDFTPFAFVSVKEFTGVPNEESFVVLSVDGSAIKTEIISMFSQFGEADGMSPFIANDVTRYEILFENGNETLTILISIESDFQDRVSFIHAENGVEIESQSYPFTSFETEINHLKNLFHPEQQI
jgi:hypothetical protein